MLPDKLGRQGTVRTEEELDERIRAIIRTRAVDRNVQRRLSAQRQGKSAEFEIDLEFVRYKVDLYITFDGDDYYEEPFTVAWPQVADAEQAYAFAASLGARCDMMDFSSFDAYLRYLSCLDTMDKEPGVYFMHHSRDERRVQRAREILQCADSVGIRLYSMRLWVESTNVLEAPAVARAVCFDMLTKARGILMDDLGGIVGSGMLIELGVAQYLRKPWYRLAFEESAIPDAVPIEGIEAHTLLCRRPDTVLADVADHLRSTFAPLCEPVYSA